MVVPPVGAGRSFKALKNTVVTKKSDARPNRRYRLDEHPPHVERELPRRLRLHHAVPPRVFLTIFLLTLTIMSFNMEVNYKPDGRPRPSRGPCPEGHRPAPHARRLTPALNTPNVRIDSEINKGLGVENKKTGQAKLYMVYRATP